MGLVDMGDGRIYRSTRDGKLERIYPETASLGIDKKRVFDYDKKSGLLKINRELFPEGTLESLTQQISENPEGITFKLNGGVCFEELEVTGVKSVQYLTSEESIYESTELPKPTRVSLMDRIKNYFSNRDL